jgi:acyl-CoA synthetase (NDP forming)
VDTAATVSADAFRQVLETLGGDPGVHAVIALILRTGATGDLLAAIAEADLSVPLAVVVLNQPEAVRLVDGRGGKVPAYAYPEVAARALSRAVRYAEWRAAPRMTVPAFPDVDAEQARQIVHGFLAGQPDGGWLARAEVADLLQAYRIPLVPEAVPRTRDDTEVAVGVREDPMFGSLVVLALGGNAARVPADYAARLTPLTETDADTLIGSVRSAPMVHGHLGDPAADVTALRGLLLRVSRLADDLPEVTELDLYPVVARPGSAVAADARIRVASQVAADPFLRRLR